MARDKNIRCISAEILRDASEGNLPVVITHKNCMDGYGSVIAIAKVLDTVLDENVLPSDLEVIYVQYGEENISEVLDKVMNRNVIIADFSFTEDITNKLLYASNILLCTDHHKSAINRWSAIDNSVVDISMSGATLIWDVLTDGTPAPLLLRYIQDRDLWDFKLPHSKGVSYVTPMLVGKDNNLDVLYSSLYDSSDLIEKGKLLGDYVNAQIEKKSSSISNSDEKEYTWY